ncbi:IclR family transcriptional regulator [Telmatospirillum siberiense]|uniref:IclR family transcriptional regulator n=2 Tax=Telmatospirillum siberiense TaxID=382514 RepID=A0A2N3PTP4_9PROT|nr:IclR family transcriptional regulator [Telmatospirillum siberiense]
MDVAEGGRDLLFVESLERGMRLLAAFRGTTDSLGLTELAAATGLTKSAAQRFAHTWERMGYLEKDARSRRFRLGIRVLELGFFFLRGHPLAGRAMPHLLAVRERLGVAVNLSLRDGADIVYAVREPDQRLTLAEMLPGRRMPAFCTSAGRALLAHCGDDELDAVLAAPGRIRYTPHTETDAQALRREIETVRRQGFAIARDQVLIGQIGVAAAVPDFGRQPAAAVNMTMTTDQWGEARIVRELVPQLMAVTEAISRG